MAPGFRTIIGTLKENDRNVKRKLLLLSIKSQFQAVKLTFDTKKKKLSYNIPIIFLKPAPLSRPHCGGKRLGSRQEEHWTAQPYSGETRVQPSGHIALILFRFTSGTSGKDTIFSSIGAPI